MSQLTTFVNSTGSPALLDINVIEFTAAVIHTAALLSHIRSTDAACTHVHLLWTDNTACRSWITKHRAAHPLHLFLLQVFSHLQLIAGIAGTSGHLPGWQDQHLRRRHVSELSGPQRPGDPRVPGAPGWSKSAVHQPCCQLWSRYPCGDSSASPRQLKRHLPCRSNCFLSFLP